MLLFELHFFDPRIINYDTAMAPFSTALRHAWTVSSLRRRPAGGSFSKSEKLQRVLALGALPTKSVLWCQT